MMKLDTVIKGSYQRYIATDFISTAFFNKRIPLIIDNVNETNLLAIRAKLLDIYGDVEINIEGDGIEKTVKVCEIDKLFANDIDAIIVDSIEMTKRLRFDFSDLVEIMKKLRAPNGCEWDKAQTHESIRINLIEEAYELVEAIDCNDKDMMLEETGDVLMQAVFHTEIAESEGSFDYCDMLTALCRKLIDRHTHIFGENHANNADEALIFWAEAKKKEKKYASTADAMSRVPKNLPSLLYAEKIQKLAKKSGFDWTNVDGALEKVAEEAKELKNANTAHQVEEAGDLLFALVNVLRFLKIDSEMALRGASEKFYKRFEQVEKMVLDSGKNMKECTLEEFNAFWEKVKMMENK